MSPTLNSYLQEVQSLVRDTGQSMLKPSDIIRNINRARREIAMRTQCIRILPDISAACMTCSVVAVGSGYSSTPTITLSAPDFPSGTGAFPGGDQATASVIVQNGTLASAFVSYGGSGYFQPTASITDVSGTGGSITVQTAAINTLNEAQEVYPFADIDLSPFPGVESVFAIQGVSAIYSNWRYSLALYSFSTYQANIRQWTQFQMYTPAYCSQYGQGVGGSFYVFPLPSQTIQFEVDAYCLPSDLETNLSVEALPEPWTDAVAYWATHLSYLMLQNFNAAKFYEDMFNRRCQGYSNYSRVSRASNPYGRY